MKKAYLLLFTYMIMAMFAGMDAQTTYSCKSPDESINVTLTLSDQALFYQVERNGNLIINTSTLGLSTVNLTDFTNGLTLVTTETGSITESYSLPTGKYSTIHNNYNELKLTLKKNTYEFLVIFRVFNDGIAFRYHIPGSGSIMISDEASKFQIANFKKSWGQEFEEGYSVYYPPRNWDETANTNLFCAPVLVENSNNDTWCLLTEAEVTGSYTSSAIKANSEIGQFQTSLRGGIESSLPLSTPWRVIVMGTLPNLVESSIIENLNPPSKIAHTSWIKAGRSSWDWGGEEGNGNVSNERAYKYIDLASQMGWEYYMQDDGWDKPGVNLQNIIDYGNSKNVKTFLWTAAERFENDEDQIRPILQNWKNMGIVGIKVDFWDADSQFEMQKYLKVIKVAAELELMVNLHGCTKPSGLQRTWPNLVTSEAVWGGEMYLFGAEFTPSNHNITIAMTRAVIGSMDYTPLDFANTHGGIKQNTTWSHQLALGVVYESGIQYMNDSPNNYKNHIAREYLKTLPAAWDDFICLEALPDQYITVARKHEDDWYVGALTEAARTLTLNLNFLDEGITYIAEIYKDGTCPSDIHVEQIFVEKGDNLSIPMFAHGGASVRISTRPLEPHKFATFEAEDNTNELLGGARKEEDELCSNSAFVGWIGTNGILKMHNIEVPESGKYFMTLYYMTGDDRETYFKIKDHEVNYSYPGWGGFNGRGLAMKTFVVMLDAGLNTIEFGNPTDYGINIDRVVISPCYTDEDITPANPVTQNSIVLTNSDAFFLYPNPVSETLWLGGASGHLSWTIYNQAGAKIMAGTSGSIRVNSLSKGAYYVSVTSDSEIFNGKFLKK